LKPGKIEQELLNQIKKFPKKEFKVIVTFKEKASPELVKAYGGRIRRVYYIIPGIAASLPGESIQELAKMKQVGHIELDKKVKALRGSGEVKRGRKYCISVSMKCAA